MKTMKCLKLYLMVLLLLVGCVLSACSQPTNVPTDNSSSRPKESQKPDVEHPESVDELDYTLLETNGKWYLVFDDISVYSSGGKSEVCTLSFDTIKELKSAIETGNLQEWQKRVVATSFSKDQVGVKVPDLEKLYVPKIPVDGVVDSVIWSGESYSFSVTYYSTKAAQLMQVRYVLTEGNKTFTVDKTYRYNEENTEGNYSLTNITMYCEDDGEKYVVDLFGFIEEPTDTWLLTFDLSEYNENELAVS